MSSTTIKPPGSRTYAPKSESTPKEVWLTIRDAVLKPLSSLKITVVLFVLSIFLVFVGSLAQAQRDVWLVVHEYFRTWIAWVQIRDFFPPSMFPGSVEYDWDSLPIKQFPFPGGWLIGWAMAINLWAAHGYRFRMSVRGTRLIAGSIAMLAGIGITWIVVLSGQLGTGDQTAPLLSYDALWQFIKWSLAIFGGVLIGIGCSRVPSSRAERWIWIVAGASSLGLFIYFLSGGNDARLANESLRILWQLILGSVAAIALLIPCILLFRKRAGIVLLHLGITMLMYSELQVAMYGGENVLSLSENETGAVLKDLRSRELAIIDRSDPEQDHVWVIPERKLLRSYNTKEAIDDDVLPFHVRVRDFVVNHQLMPLGGAEKPPAESGVGSFAAASPMRPVTGMDSTSDTSAVYVDLVDPEDGEVFETRLLSQEATQGLRDYAERIRYNGTEYDLYLRHTHSYRPWKVTLIDVSREDYIGTTTPKDYRSTFRIRDDEGNEATYTTWMNNPVRYGGETFYQQGYQNIEGFGEITTLQVVRNTGWMLPYVGCMIVAFGMFAQFGLTLSRFLRPKTRLSVQSAADAASTTSPPGPFDVDTAAAAVRAPSLRPASESPGVFAWLLPLVLVGMFVAFVGRSLMVPAPRAGVTNLYAFGQIPTAYGGRVLPLDTVARTTLLSTLNKSTLKGELEPGELDSKREKLIAQVQKYWPETDTTSLESINGDYPAWITAISEATGAETKEVDAGMRPHMTATRSAIWWFMDVITRPEVAERHRAYRIRDDRLLALLNLEQRSGLAYSLSEIRPQMGDLTRLAVEARQFSQAGTPEKITPLQRRASELFSEIRRVEFLSEFFQDRELAPGQPLGSIVDTWQLLKRLEDHQAPLSIPTGSDDSTKSWQSFIAADAVVRLREILDDHEINSAEGAKVWLKTKLLSDRLTKAIALNLEMLEGTIRNDKPAATDDEVREEMRLRALQYVASQDAESYLSNIMLLVARREGSADAAQIVAGMTQTEIAEVAGPIFVRDIEAVIQTLDATDDYRLDDLRRLTMSLAQQRQDPTEALLGEIVDLTVDDLDQRVGFALFGNDPGIDVMKSSVAAMKEAFEAWKSADSESFNIAVARLHERMETVPSVATKVSRVNFETFLNHFEPQWLAIYIYLPVLILSFLSWMFWKRPLWNSAWLLMALAFVLHTFFLGARIYISGRPPITSLYSTAVFIGWAVVGAGLIAEFFVRYSVFNVIGAGAGASTLVIAHFLAMDEGDTMSVMQAVLDTQFWLATHVVIINLGYAATLLAGLLGGVYCVVKLIAGSNPKNDMAEAATMIGKMVYGTICFALFFSFVGTVLGGLWADDSWGRFWGWDPKENGALLIVIWNALILHARWDKLVRDYGTAVLAIGGNIITAWSWFGVNELGVGLHKYGFTEGRLMYLGLFMLANLLLIIGAMIGNLSARIAAIPVAPGKNSKGGKPPVRMT